MFKSLRRIARRALKGSATKFGSGASALVKYRGAIYLANSGNKLEARLLTGHYDDEIFDLIESIVGPGDICFDVGSNIGIYAAILSKLVGPNGAVHAFEPVDHIRRKNKTNLVLNGATNVTLNAIALGERDGEVPMLQVKEGHIRGGTSSLLHTENMDSMGAGAFDSKPVQLMTLDTYVSKHAIKGIRFIKVDIEGYELNFLRGAQETLDREKPILFMEYSQPRLQKVGVSEADFKQALIPLGYQAYEFGRSDGTLYLIPFNFDRQIHGRDIVAIPV